MAEVNPAPEMLFVSTLSELDKMGAAIRPKLDADFINRVRNLKLLGGFMTGALVQRGSRRLSPTHSAWPAIALAALAGGGAGLLQHWSTTASKEEELARQMLDQQMASRRNLEKRAFDPFSLALAAGTGAAGTLGGSLGKLVIDRIVSHVSSKKKPKAPQPRMPQRRKSDAKRPAGR